MDGGRKSSRERQSEISDPREFLSKTNNLVTNNLKSHLSPDHLVGLKEFLRKGCKTLRWRPLPTEPGEGKINSAGKFP